MGHECENGETMGLFKQWQLDQYSRSVMVTLQLWWLLPRSAALTFPDTVFIPLFNYLILVRDSLGARWSEHHMQTMHCWRLEQLHTCSVTVTQTRVSPIPGHVSNVSNARLSLSLSPSNSPTITPAVDRSQCVRGDWWQIQLWPGEWEWYQHNPAISMLMTRTGMGRVSPGQPPLPLLCGVQTKSP